MSRTIARRRPTRRAALLITSLLALLVVGGHANSAGAAHLTYCGHTHSAGYDHETKPGNGDYYWVQFRGQENIGWLHVHYYVEYFHHINGYNQPLHAYSKWCPGHAIPA